MTGIPFVDLAGQHSVVSDEVTQRWPQILADCAFIADPQLAAFEREFATLRRTGTDSTRPAGPLSAWSRSRTRTGTGLAPGTSPGGR